MTEVAAVKLAGFLLLLAVIFTCAHVIGDQVGPVTTGHSPAQYNTTGNNGQFPAQNTGGQNTGGQNTGDMSGMNMGNEP
jgi:hypothetical protein